MNEAGYGVDSYVILSVFLIRAQDRGGARASAF